MSKVATTDTVTDLGEQDQHGNEQGAGQKKELKGILHLDDPAVRAALTEAGDSAAGSTKQWLGELNATKRALDQMDKVTVFLPQVKTGRFGRAPLPALTVQINDYTYHIERGVAVQVPQEVARIIVESGAHEIQ